MTSFLKGNYQLPGKDPEVEASKAQNAEEPKDLTQEFEASALAKLGGSICFVVKSETLLWNGDQSEGAG